MVFVKVSSCLAFGMKDLKLSDMEPDRPVNLGSVPSVFTATIGNRQERGSKSDSETDAEWVLDSLIGFLQGPIWNIPIISFIEQKSIVFEPEIETDDGKQEEDEQKPTQVSPENETKYEEYRRIFGEYAALVDRLLASHMDDLQISLEQFEEACKNAKGSLGPKFHRTLFEQIWAANDFDIFMAMMIKRNLELHIQAMNILTRSLDPETLGHSEDQEPLQFLIDDDALLKEVIKISLDSSQEQPKMDEKLHEDVMKIALEERDRLEAERVKEEKKLEKALQKVMESSEAHQTQKEMAHQQVGHSQGDKKLESKEQEKLSAKDDASTSVFSGHKKSISPEEVKQRQEYLRNQRDKIIETKQKERQKQVKQLEQKELKEKRPKSAKAVSSVISKNGEDSSNEAKGLNFRRSLAARLKEEVINK